jgi:hypothetical protein
MSAIDQSRSVTPAAIAGVTRSVSLARRPAAMNDAPGHAAGTQMNAHGSFRYDQRSGFSMLSDDPPCLPRSGTFRWDIYKFPLFTAIMIGIFGRFAYRRA